MADELQFTTPQDKLLIMLLERISALEDTQHKLRQAVEKSNENLEQLWQKSSSVYFGITMRTKQPSPPPASTAFGFGTFGVNVLGTQYTFTSEKLEIVKNIITDTFPQSTLTIIRNPFVTFYLEFQSPMLLDTIKEALELKLLHHVHILSWSTLSKSEMTNVLHRNPYEVETI